MAIVGVGLIGGSVGLALKRREPGGRVVGIGRSPTRLGEALDVGAIDEATTDFSQGVARAARHGPGHVLVTDAGSTKRRIVEAVEREPRSRAVFVGGHPLAGSERQGVGHARAELFDGRVCVLTPTAQTPVDRLERARRFWAALGCQIHELDPAAHDEALALTSHLPHALAAALANTVPAGSLTLAAGAFRDGTRVAGADASLWSGIFLENREPLLRALERFEAELATFRQALEARDEIALRAWWMIARQRRGQFDEQQRARRGIEG